MGSLSSEQIKDFKQGIAEVLMDEAFFKHYDRIVQLQVSRSPAGNPNEMLAVTAPL